LLTCDAPTEGEHEQRDEEPRVNFGIDSATDVDVIDDRQ
jgi:hypothetical protein